MRSDLTRLYNWYRNHSTRYFNLLHEYNLLNCLHSRYFSRKFNQVTDTLKQQIAALSKRLRRYNKSYKRKIDNKNFIRNEKRFYANLMNQTKPNNVNVPPEKEEVVQYWKNLWSNPVQHNTQVSRIKDEIERFKHTEQMRLQRVTVNDVQNVVNRAHNWKSPGLDKIHNYWWKYFTSVHPHLGHHINNVIEHPEQMPAFLNQGITYLQPKCEEIQNAKNYRPITCLNTLFKIITCIITDRVEEFITNNQIMTENQKGCKKNSRGCKEQLIIDHVICAQAKKRCKNLSVAWVDYVKAYDSVPHSWLLQVLSIYRIDPKLIDFLKHSMNQWMTKLSLTLPAKKNNNNNNTSRGIFQGDSWSPLWFCLSLNPLSNILNESNKGYNLNRNTQQKVSHLMYMDDLKLYAKDISELQSMLETTCIFSNDIHMKFGIDKCATLEVRRGKIQTQNNIDLTTTPMTLPSLNQDPNATYKYLGVKQSLLFGKEEVKQNLINTYTMRVKKILSTSLNGFNKIKGINTWCIPILTYSFGVVPWTKTDLQDLDRRTRVLMTQYRMHHPKACTERLYLPRKRGGQGLINLEKQANRQIKNLKTYFFKKKENSMLHEEIINNDDNYSALNLKNEEMPGQVNSDNELEEKWKNKTLHGRYKKALEGSHASSNDWLQKQSSIYCETEGFIMAIQDQVIKTKNYVKYIEKLDVPNDTCRVCHQVSETIQHITSACSALAQTEYLYRHNLSAKIVHQYIANKHELVTSKEPHYKYDPEPILENHKFKLYWDTTIVTDRHLPHNRPDIVLVNKEEKTVKLIDIAHPNDHNLIPSMSEKIRKYQDLGIEIKDMWNMNNVDIIPVIISTNGLIHPTLYEHCKKIELPSYILSKIQKSVLLETCRIVRKVLSF
ncbi:hypothetical protein WDU94_005635 [Cyamophila willieti]